MLLGEVIKKAHPSGGDPEEWAWQLHRRFEALEPNFHELAFPGRLWQGNLRTRSSVDLRDLGGIQGRRI